jgi:hypothetical protein
VPNDLFGDVRSCDVRHDSDMFPSIMATNMVTYPINDGAS